MGGISYSQRFILFVMLHAVLPRKIMRAESFIPMGLSSVLYDQKPFELALFVIWHICASPESVAASLLLSEAGALL